MTSQIASGALTNPILIPAESILEKLSNRTTLPVSGSAVASSEK